MNVIYKVITSICCTQSIIITKPMILSWNIIDVCLMMMMMVMVMMMI